LLRASSNPSYWILPRTRWKILWMRLKPMGSSPTGAAYIVPCFHPCVSHQLLRLIYPDLNRSQPPLFIMVCLIHAVAFDIPHTKWIRCSQIMSRPRMILRSSIEHSLWLRHVTIRHHFPAAEDIPQRELAWWSNNRSLAVTSPYTNKTYTLSRYAVTNSAPRPESYLTGMSCHHTCGTLMKRLT